MSLPDDAYSLWSGGVQWGTATNSRADAYWQPGTAVAPTSGRPEPDAAIGGVLVTAQLLSASWNLGISDYLADLSPSTASVTLAGTVVAEPGDDVVISTAHGAVWAGRVDTIAKTRDVNGDYWTTVSATDRVGGLGAALLNDWTFAAPATLEALGESLANDAGIGLDIVDQSVSGLEELQGGPPGYNGTVLDIINKAAKASNAMLAAGPNGKLYAVVREAVTPSSVLTLTGVNAPVEWTEATTIDGIINRLRTWAVGPGVVTDAGNADSIAAYGERVFDASEFSIDPGQMFAEWQLYYLATPAYYPSGISPLPVASASLVVASWAQDDLILLSPFQWVTESSTDWMVLNVSHSVTASPFSWSVSITLDRLLDAIVDIP